MKGCIVRRAVDSDIKHIIELSGEWESEQITYGLRTNTPEDLDGLTIWVAEIDEKIVGYLSGEVIEKKGQVMKGSDVCFNVDEIYVAKDYRSGGIGKRLFDYMEEYLKSEGIQNILVVSCTKDQERILNFYVNEIGLKVWSTTLYKNLY